MVPIDHFDTTARLSPDTVALVDGDASLTFGEVAAISHRVAHLVSQSASGQDPVRVAVYSPNDFRVMLAHVGIMRAGGAIVPVHPGNPVEVTERFLSTVSPQCAFYHSSLEAQVRQLRESVRSITQWICLDGDVFNEIVATRSAGEPYAAEWIDPCGNRDRPVYYWPTSGTTGEPKVVVDDVGSFEGALWLVRELHQRDCARPVTLAIAPLSHGAGPHSFGILTLGGTVVVMRQFEAGAALQAIEQHGVTDVWLPPTALYLLLDRPDIRDRKLSSLQHVTLGTAAVAAARVKEAVDVFGACVSQTYGQIESGFITALDPETTAAAARGVRPERLASAGRSVFVNRVAIMSDSGRLLPPREEGEIVVRGRCVKRYMSDDATAAARRFGWHHTGDIGYLDDEGFLYIVGRKRDVVNMAGLKIPAAEIEGVIMELAEVLECAVVAVPDAIRGEVATAVIAPKRGHSVTAAAVLAHCRRRLGVQRAPSSAQQWPQLPRSPAGKIDKLTIRRLIIGEQP